MSWRFICRNLLESVLKINSYVEVKETNCIGMHFQQSSTVSGMTIQSWPVLRQRIWTFTPFPPPLSPIIDHSMNVGMWAAPWMRHDFRQGGSIPLREIPGQQFGWEPQPSTIPAPGEWMLRVLKGGICVMHHSLYYYYRRVQCSSKKFLLTCYFSRMRFPRLWVCLPCLQLSDAVIYLRLQRETFISLSWNAEKSHALTLFLGWIFLTLVSLPTLAK